MGSEDFLKPTLRGSRFDGHEIPLEFMADFAALQEMVIDVAKNRFLKANPKRERAPRGFSTGISLTLSNVEEGSAIPVIKLAFSSALLFAAGNAQHFYEARDDIVRAIGAAEQNKSVSEFLPDKALAYFDRFGRSLRDDESIEFATTNGPVRLTKEVRRRLVLAATEVDEVTEEVTVYGAIPEADQKRLSFEIELLDGKTIFAPLTRQHRDTVIEAFNTFEKMVLVRVQGIGKFDRSSRLKNFDSVEEMSIVDPLDVGLRVEQLKQLSDGWLEGAGRAPNPAFLKWFLQRVDKSYPPDLPIPYIYPTPDANLRLEWTVTGHDVSLEIDANSFVGSLHDWDSATEAETTETLVMSQDDGWTRLAEFIGGLSGATE